MGRKKPKTILTFSEYLLCLDDRKNNPDIPELDYGTVYKVVERSCHGRPRIEVMNEDGVMECVYYDPSRFIPCGKDDTIEDYKRRVALDKQLAQENKIQRQKEYIESIYR